MLRKPSVWPKPETEPLGVALVGVGRWGRCWRELLQRFPGVKLRWVCDPVETALDGVPDHVCKASSLDVALQDTLLNAVVIATPPETHEVLALRAMAAGLHVLVEKPLATSPEGVERLARAAAECRVCVMVNHVLVYHPAFQRLLELVQRGAIGTVQNVFGVRTALQHKRDECTWWRLAPHDLSMLARVAPELLAGELSVYENGSETRARLRTSTQRAELWFDAECREKQRIFVVQGSAGTLVFDDEAPEELCFHTNAPLLTIKGLKLTTATGWPKTESWLSSALGHGEAVPFESGTPLEAALAHFVECVRRGIEPQTGFEEARRVIEVLARGSSFGPELGSMIQLGVNP